MESLTDDTDDRDAETSVKTLGSVLGEDLLEAVNETAEFALSTGADVSSETGSGEIERVDDGEGSGTGSTTGGAVTEEELDWLGLGVVWVEDGLVEVLEREVQGLRGEVPDDVGHVTSPEGTEALLLDHSLEAVADTVVSILDLDLSGGILHLEEKLDSLDRGDESLGDSGGDTTHHEIGNEALFLRLTGHLQCSV